MPEDGSATGQCIRVVDKSGQFLETCAVVLYSEHCPLADKQGRHLGTKYNGGFLNKVGGQTCVTSADVILWGPKELRHAVDMRQPYIVHGASWQNSKYRRLQASESVHA